MPFIWCLGSIVGPALGGLLANPTQFYPGVFPPGGLLEEYPFLLPNLVSGIVLVFGIANGILFLEETHDELRHKRDWGLVLGRKLINLFSWRSSRAQSTSNERESERLLSEDNRSYSGGNEYNDDDVNIITKLPSVSMAFTRPVIKLVVSYFILAYHTMAFDQLMPVFLSTPISDEIPHSLLRFTGGLGMTTQAIGFILSMQGIFSMCTQFTVFPPVARHFGILNVYRFCVFTYATSYFIVPYLDWLPAGKLQMAGVYGVLAIKIVYGVLAYPCNAILLTNSAPSLLVLGAINGIASSCASLARAISPTLTGMIYSFGLDNNCVGLAWWANGVVCLVGALQVLTMKNADFEGQAVEGVGGVVDEEVVHAGPAMETNFPISNVNIPIMGGVEETFDEYGLVRSVVESDIAHLSMCGSIPQGGTLESLTRLDMRTTH